jgi:transcription elongation GreA/GreB family factor
VDKRLLVDQIRTQLEHSARTARGAGEDAAAEARFGVEPGERRHDARVAIEFASLARAQSKRAEAAQAELAELAGFQPRALARGAAIEVGAVVEIEDEHTGEGRTFFIAPVGAGMTLTGPGGDGVLSVVTPASPVGRAVLGHRTGETVDVTVKGEPRAWRITYTD